MTIFTFLPSFVQAETCTPTPKCEDLGYTQTSCPDNKGVRCPWNTNLMHCGKTCPVCPQCEQISQCQRCYVGMILNSDKTCYSVKINGKTPIGIVAWQNVTNDGNATSCKGIAVAMNELGGAMTWNTANSESKRYTAGDVSGWHLPSKDELIAIHKNIDIINPAMDNLGGKTLFSTDYWSSSTSYYAHWVVNPITGGTYDGRNGNNNIARPVLNI